MNKATILTGAAMFSVALISAGAQAQGTMDKIEGTGKELQGSAKEAVGKATGDTRLEWSGKADKVEGAGQKAVGDVKSAADGISSRLAGIFTRLGDFVARIF